MWFGRPPARFHGAESSQQKPVWATAADPMVTSAISVSNILSEPSGTASKPGGQAGVLGSGDAMGANGVSGAYQHPSGVRMQNHRVCPLVSSVSVHSWAATTW